jgi:hypothetical protein
MVAGAAARRTGTADAQVHVVAMAGTVGLLLAGCGVASPAVGMRSAAPAVSDANTSAAAAVSRFGGPLVVPSSGHVTGIYPARCTQSTGSIPDPICTPGAVQAAVTQASIASTICRHGWTSAVRAPEAETSKVKKAAMLAYGLPVSGSRTTELDHFVPLELGGANDVRNLWPEPSDEPGHGVANTKDNVENHLNAAACRGQVPLAAAQQAIAADWTTAEQHLGLPSP